MKRNEKYCDILRLFFVVDRSEECKKGVFLCYFKRQKIYFIFSRECIVLKFFTQTAIYKILLKLNLA